MAKKDFANLTADLSALAASMPTQRPVPAPALVAVPAAALSSVTVPVEEAPPPAEVLPKLAVIAQTSPPAPITQFSLSLRKELHKQLGRLASDADMTMRAFVLNALKEKGLAVTEDDLKDLRRERR